VVDVLRVRIEQLAPRVQRILVLAAFLGFYVDTDLLESISRNETEVLPLQTLSSLLGGGGGRTEATTDQEGGDNTQSSSLSSSSEHNSTTVASALHQIEMEGLFELTCTGDEKLGRFSHDRIQECVYNQIAAGRERDLVHHQIGMHTWKNYCKLGADPVHLFLATDQLNRGATIITEKNDPDELLFLVTLNYEAALAAKSRIGVETVAAFVDKAVTYVAGSGFNYWDDGKSYDLMLDLHSLAAEVEFNRGNFERSDEHINTVLRFSREERDTVRALVARAHAHVRIVKGWLLLPLDSSVLLTE